MRRFLGMLCLLGLACKGSDGAGNAPGAGGSSGVAATTAGSSGGTTTGTAGMRAGLSGNSAGTTATGGPGTGGTKPTSLSGNGGGSAGTMTSSAGRMGGQSGRNGRGGSAAGASGSATAGQGAAGNGCTQDVHCKLAAMPTSGDIRQDCVDRINQFRTQCACLPALARWTDAEACADMMAQYDSGMPNSAHAGFKLNPQLCMPHGSAQDECPGWRSNDMVVSGCLQSMWDEGPPPTNPCNDACFQMYGHFINMSSTGSTKVACGFYTTADGKIWAVQNFSR